MILLGSEEIMAVSGMMDVPPRYSRLIGDLVAKAQHAADVAWLEGRCPHVRPLPKGQPIQKRHYCPHCWEKFVTAGKE